MGRDDMRGEKPRSEMANVTGLEKLIGEMDSTDLTLAGEPDAKVQQLQQRVENVTASGEDRKRLRELLT